MCFSKRLVCALFCAIVCLNISTFESTKSSFEAVAQERYLDDPGTNPEVDAPDSQVESGLAGGPTAQVPVRSQLAGPASATQATQQNLDGQRGPDLSPEDQATSAAEGEVGANGAYTYLVSLPVPAGVNGHAPKLVLGYSSDNNLNGILGRGWMVNAPSCIQRGKGPTMSPRTEKLFRRGAPEMIASDVFYRDGVRLIRCEDGLGGASKECPLGTYRAVQNDFSRIERQPSDLSEGWRVTTVDGTILEYLPSRSSQQQDVGTSILFNSAVEFCLSKSIKNGNEIRYGYTEFGTVAGERLLTSIDYGGYGSSPARWQITFEYEERTDRELSFFSGGRDYLSHRLKRIAQFSAPTEGSQPNTLIRAHHFNYEIRAEPVRSLLKSIQEFGSDGVTALPAHEFTYAGDATKGWNSTQAAGWSALPAEATFFQEHYWASGSNEREYGSFSLTPADLNGDGYVDFFRHSFPGPYARALDPNGLPTRVWLNDRNGGWQRDTQWEQKLAVIPRTDDISHPEENIWQGLWNVSISRGVAAIDLNGDSYTDFLRIDNPNCESAPCPHYDISVHIYDPLLGVYVAKDPLPWVGSLTAPQFVLTWDHPSTNVLTKYHDYDPGTRFADVDGDGLIDVVVLRSGYQPMSQVFKNTGSGFVPVDWQIPALARFVNNLAPSEAAPEGNNRTLGVKFGDLNGDGLPDLVQAAYHADLRCNITDPGTDQNGVNYFNVWLNNGKGWEFSQEWKDALEATLTDPANNGLGALFGESFAYVLPYSDIFGNHNCNAPSYRWYLNDPYSDELIDINGDGKDDIVQNLGPGCPRLFQYSYINTGSGWTNDRSEWHLPNSEGSSCIQDGPSLFYWISNLHESGTRFVSVDGDGRPDLVRGYAGSSNFAILNKSRFDRDLLITLENPNGGSYSITYQELKSSTENPELLAAKTVVSNVSFTNGQSATTAIAASRSYFYSGGRHDRNSREFLGFKVVRVENPVVDGKGRVVTRWYKNEAVNDVCRPGALEQEIISDKFCANTGSSTELCLYSSAQGLIPQVDQTSVAALGILMSTKNIWSYSCGGDPTGPFFYPPEATFSSSYDPGHPDRVKTTLTRFSYGPFGNLVAKVEYDDTSASATPVRSTIARFPFHKLRNSPSPGPSWIVSKPCEISVTDGQNRLIKKSVNFYDNSTTLCAVPTQGWLTREEQHGYNSQGGEDSYTWREISYSPWGNVASTTTPPPAGMTQPSVESTLWDSVFPYIFPRGIRNALDQLSTNDFDQFGNLYRNYDLNAVATEFHYDTFQRLSERFVVNGDSASPHVIREYSDSGDPNTQFWRERTRLDDTRWISTEHYLDGLGLEYLTLVKGTSGSPIAVATKHNARLKPTRTTNPYFGTGLNLSKPGYTFLYDSLDRPIASQLPGGGFTTREFSLYPDGQSMLFWEKITVPNGSKTLRRHLFMDGLERLVRVTECNTEACDDPGAPSSDIYTTRYRYDVLDNRTWICMSDGSGSCAAGTSRSRFFYDGLGRLIGSKDPDQNNCVDPNVDSLSSGCPTLYTHDAAGNLSHQTDAGYNFGSGSSIDYRYDALGRLTKKIISEAGNPIEVSLTYDQACAGVPSYALGRVAKGTRTKLNDSSDYNETCLGYDMNGNVASRKRQVAIPGSPTASATVQAAFNRLGSEVSSTLPGGEVLNYVRDDFGRVTSVTSSIAGTIVSSVIYRATGDEDLRTLGNGVVIDASYRDAQPGVPNAEGDGRLDSIVSTPSNLINLKYDYDMSGAITHLTDNVAQVAEVYDYDHLGRLISVIKNGTLAEQFTYDRLGSRSYSLSANASTQNVVKPAARSGAKRSSLSKLQISDESPIVDQAPSQILAYYSIGSPYNADGGSHAITCRSSAPNCSGDTELFSYDRNGNMMMDYIASTPSFVRTFHYNYANKLVRAEGPGFAAKYYYDHDENKVASVEQGNQTIYFDSTYELRNGEPWITYALDGKLIATRDSQGLVYYLTDHLGSVRKVIKPNNQVVKSVSYQAFGESVESGDGASLRFKYNGAELDSSGVYDRNARSYKADLGQFIQPDSIIPDLSNPQSLNRRSYTYNNPINFVDPSGHDPLMILLDYFDMFPPAGSEETTTGAPPETNQAEIRDNSQNQHTQPQAEIRAAVPIVYVLPGYISATGKFVYDPSSNQFYAIETEDNQLGGTVTRWAKVDMGEYSRLKKMASAAQKHNRNIEALVLIGAGAKGASEMGKVAGRLLEKIPYGDPMFKALSKVAPVARFLGRFGGVIFVAGIAYDAGTLWYESLIPPELHVSPPTTARVHVNSSPTYVNTKASKGMYPSH